MLPLASSSVLAPVYNFGVWVWDVFGDLKLQCCSLTSWLCDASRVVDLAHPYCPGPTAKMSAPMVSVSADAADCFHRVLMMNETIFLDPC